MHEIAILAASLLILTACGSNVSSSGTSSAASTAVASATATPNAGNIYDLPAAYSMVATINGQGGAVPSVTSAALATSRTFKVRVTPLQAPHMTLAGYTGYVFPYGCLSMEVTVNGVTQMTNNLQVGGVAQSSTSVCANSPAYQVLDFSNDVSGNGTVSATISSGDYDNCRYVNALTYGCMMTAMFSNHVASATITIETDGTYMDESAAN
jgi:hypothetical protein